MGSRYTCKGGGRGGFRYPYGSQYLYKGGLGNCNGTVDSTDTEAVSVSVQVSGLGIRYVRMKYVPEVNHEGLCDLGKLLHN